MENNNGFFNEMEGKMELGDEDFENLDVISIDKKESSNEVNEKFDEIIKENYDLQVNFDNMKNVLGEEIHFDNMEQMVEINVDNIEIVNMSSELKQHQDMKYIEIQELQNKEKLEEEKLEVISDMENKSAKCSLLCSEEKHHYELITEPEMTLQQSIKNKNIEISELQDKLNIMQKEHKKTVTKVNKIIAKYISTINSNIIELINCSDIFEIGGNEVKDINYGLESNLVKEHEDDIIESLTNLFQMQNEREDSFETGHFKTAEEFENSVRMLITAKERIENLMKELRIKSEEVDNLKSTVELNDYKIQQLSNSIIDLQLKAEIDEMKSGLEKNENEYNQSKITSEFENKLKQIEDEHNLMMELKETKLKLETSQKSVTELENMEIEYLKKINEMKLKLEESNIKNEQLKNEIGMLTQKSENDFRMKDEECNKVSNDLKTVNIKLQASQQEVEKLNIKVEECVSQEDIVNKENEKMKNQVAIFSELENCYKQKQDEMMCQLKDARAKLAELENGKATYEKEIEVIKNKLDECYEENENLKIENETLTALKNSFSVKEEEYNKTVQYKLEENCKLTEELEKNKLDFVKQMSEIKMNFGEISEENEQLKDRVEHLEEVERHLALKEQDCNDINMKLQASSLKLEENSNLIKQLEDMKTENLKEIENTKREIDVVNKENEELKHQMEAALKVENSLAQKEQECSAIKMELEHLKVEHLKEIESVKKEVEDMNIMFEESQKENEQLKSQMNSSLAELKSNIEQREKEYNDIKAKLEVTRGKFQDSCKNTEELENKVTQYLNERNDACKKFEEISQEFNALEENTNEKIAEIEKLKSNISLLDGKYEKCVEEKLLLIEELDNTKSINSNLDKELVITNQEMEMLRNECTHLKELTDENKQIKHQTETFSELEAYVKQKEEAYNNILIELKQTKLELEQSSKLIEKLENNKMEYDKEIKAMKLELEGCCEENENLKTEHERLSEQKKDFAEKEEEMVNELQILKCKLEENYRLTEELENSKIDYDKQMKEIEISFDEINKENGQLKNQIEELSQLQRNFVEKEKEYNDIIMELKKPSCEVEGNYELVKQLEEKHHTELNNAMNEIENMKIQLEQNQKENEQLKLQIESHLDVKHKIAQREMEYNTVTTELEIMKEKFKNSCEETKELESQVTQYLNDRNDDQKKFEELNEKNNILEKSLNEKNGEISELKIKIFSSDDKYQKCKEEKVLLIEKLNELQKEIEDFDNKRKTIDENMEALDNQGKDLQHQIEGKTNNNAELQKCLTDAEEKLRAAEGKLLTMYEKEYVSGLEEKVEKKDQELTELKTRLSVLTAEDDKTSVTSNDIQQEENKTLQDEEEKSLHHLKCKPSVKQTKARGRKRNAEESADQVFEVCNDDSNSNMSDSSGGVQRILRTRSAKSLTETEELKLPSKRRRKQMKEADQGENLKNKENLNVKQKLSKKGEETKSPFKKFGEYICAKSPALNAVGQSIKSILVRSQEVKSQPPKPKAETKRNRRVLFSVDNISPPVLATETSNKRQLRTRNQTKKYVA